MEKIYWYVMLPICLLLMTATGYALYRSAIAHRPHSGGGPIPLTAEEIRGDRLSRQASAERKRHEFASAIADYRKAISLERWKSSDMRFLAETLEDNGYDDAALAEYLAFRSQPDTWSINADIERPNLLRFGEVALRIGKSNVAQELFRMANTITNFETPDGLVTDGSATADASDRSLATYQLSKVPMPPGSDTDRFIRNASELSPKWAMGHLLKGCLDLKIQMNEQARAEMVQAIKLARGQTLAIAVNEFEGRGLDKEAKRLRRDQNRCFRRGRVMNSADLTADVVAEYESILFQTAKELLKLSPLPSSGDSLQLRVTLLRTTKPASPSNKPSSVQSTSTQSTPFSVSSSS